MLNFKKIAAVVLSIIMTFSFSIFASAASTDTAANLTTSYDNSGQFLQVTLSTTNAVAGIKGTFTYDATAVQLLPDSTTFDDINVTDNTVANSLNCSAGSVAFVLLGDVTNGSTKWVTFKFTVLKTATTSFSLNGMSVCNVDEQDVTTTINNNSISVSVEALSTLGAQIRTETTTGTTQDIRFGSKLVRNVSETGEYITVGGTSYKATSCGYLVALTGNLAEGELMVAVKSTNTHVKNKQSTKCYLRTDDYFIYTLVVTGITSANNATQISVRPYVVYDIEGVDYYSYGNQVSKSINDVAAVTYK
ncbi:MAG: hypothetical protein WCR45_03530 [Bacteroidaceae bacterium]